MNADEIRLFLQRRGYTSVTVKGFSKSCRIHVNSDKWSEVRNLGVPLSAIDTKYLSPRYPPVVSVQKDGKEVKP